MPKPYHRTQNPRMLKKELLEIIQRRGYKVRDSRVVAHNTIRFTTDEKQPKTVLWYTETPVVTFNPQTREVILNSGGYMLARTKDRINDELRRIFKEIDHPKKHNFCVMTDRGTWFIDCSKAGRCRFYDGMRFRILTAAGFSTELGRPIKLLNHYAGKKAAQRMDKDIKRIEALCDTAKLRMLKDGPIPYSAGDCFTCQMLAFGEPKVKRGEVVNGMLVVTEPDINKELHRRDYSHYIGGENTGHVQHQYLHGSLIVVALLWAGWPEKSICYWFRYLDPAGREHDRKRAAELITHHLRRFLKHHAGLPHK